MLNIVIPMAGAGSRFSKAGYADPKPFINVNGKTMIFTVLENIGIAGAKYIFICQKQHLIRYGSEFVESLYKRSFIRDFEIITVDSLTDGAASTILKSKPFINNKDELLIVNSDQMLGMGDIGKSLNFFENNHCDAGVICFFSKDSKWSYVNIDSQGLITSIAEKKAISDHATAGIYYFKEGKYFVNAAETMISKNDRVNNEFYVAPTLNYMILENMTVKPFFINEMHGLGTPEDLERFLRQ